MLYQTIARRIRWPFHSYKSFHEKEIIHQVICNFHPLTGSHHQLLQRKELQKVWVFHFSTVDRSEFHLERSRDRCFQSNSSIYHQLSIIKSQTSLYECRIVFVPRSLQMKISLLTGWTEKWNSSEKRILRYSFFTAPRILFPTPSKYHDDLQLM